MSARRSPPERGGIPPRLLAASLITGAAAGGLGIGLSALLRVSQHVAFDYQHGRFAAGVAAAGDTRRVVAATLAGLVAGAGWWALGHARGGTSRVDVNAAIRGKRLPLLGTLLGSLLQIVTVGLGAPLGREGAPREAGAAAGEVLSRRLRLTPQQRRLILAAGSGAGLAAVYNVPVGGALFALEGVLRTRRPRDAVVAAVTSATATAVALLGLPDRPTYVVPALHVTPGLCVFAVLVGPVAGITSAAFRRTMARARTRAVTGRAALVAAATVGAATGGLAAWQPQVLGNGKGPVQLALDHALPAATLLALLVLRPLATAAVLRSGVVGGVLTPALASGALLGALAGAGWNYLWPGTAFAAFVLVTGTAFLAGAQRAPLTALALGIEFTHAPPAVLLPLALATAGAYAIAGPMTRRSAE